MSRSRASRAAASVNKEDADEEKTIWNHLKGEAKRVDEMVTRSNEKWDRMCDLQTEINARAARGVSPSSSIEDELGDLARDNIKLLDDIRALTEGDRDDSSLSILRSLDVLAALKSSSEAESASGPRSATLNSTVAGGSKERKRANSKIPGSPIVAASKVDSRAGSKVGSRLSGTSRHGSMPATAKSDDGLEDSQRPYEVYQKIPLVVGTEVLYRLHATPTGKGSHRNTTDSGTDRTESGPSDRDPTSSLLDGEGILCSITAILGGEGKNRRYEIRDSDPDPSTPPHPYKATSSQLVPIPASNESLPFLEHGTHVLALYPSTTTFYKAEVAVWTGTKNSRAAGTIVRLRFEGEDEADKEEEVERRYVIPEP